MFFLQQKLKFFQNEVYNLQNIKKEIYIKFETFKIYSKIFVQYSFLKLSLQFEDRLIKQNMSFQIQQQIKRNAQQIKSYVTDLYDWQHQMQLKQKAKIRVLKQERDKQEQISKQLQKQIQQKKKQHQQNQQIKQKKVDKQNEIQKEKPKDLVRDSSTIKDYYNAWDSYDIDKQLKKLQDDETRPYKPYNPYEHSQNYVRAKPKAKVNINIQRQRTAVIDPTQLKDKGNLHYKVCEYQKAIDAYTQCIDKLQEQQINQKTSKLKSVVLSNRAMTYMKINQRAKALQDCNQSIMYDPIYVKSYLRRADCHKKLGNYRQSLKDFNKVKQLDPEDKEVDQQIKKIQKYLEKLYKEARQSLILKELPSNFKESYRINIEQTQNCQQILKNKNTNQKKENKVNFLEEL